MSESMYVGWWSLGYVEEHQKPILEGLDYDRVETNSGLYLVFDDRADAMEAAEGGLIICEVDGDVEQEELSIKDVREADTL